MKLSSLILKFTKHVIQIRNWRPLWYHLLEKQMCAAEKNGSTSLENDNICYVSFGIREEECVPWCGEIQYQRSEVLGKTFNLHSNSTWCPRCVVS